MKYSLIFIFGLLLLLSCSDDTISSADDIVFPEENVSWQNHVQPFLKFTCAYQGCHSSNTQAAGIVLDDYFQMNNSMSGALVIPGKPDQSYLIQMLDGKFEHRYGYIWRPKVNDNHKQGMRTWVEEGAQFN